MFKELTDESFELERIGNELFLQGKGRVTKAAAGELADRYRWWSRKVRSVGRGLGFLDFLSASSSGIGVLSYLSNPSKAAYETDFCGPLLTQRRFILKAEDKAAGQVESRPGWLRPLRPKVFIVHGHNERYLRETVDAVRKLGLDPVVLRDRPNKGRTIIEKLEDYSDVHFAVVLLTGDDIGGLRDHGEEGLSPRARQNVVYELGFFNGALGRGKVCALVERGVEKPSDYQGVLYIPLDDLDRWKIDLGRELRAAGLPVLLAGIG